MSNVQSSDSPKVPCLHLSQCSFFAYGNDSFAVGFSNSNSDVAFYVQVKVKPDALKHSVFTLDHINYPMLSDLDTVFNLHFKCVQDYLDVCELFNMIPDFDVVRACSRSCLDDLGEE